MFKKSDPWEAGIKIFSKFFGFDTEDDFQANQNSKGANGIMGLKSNS